MTPATSAIQEHTQAAIDDILSNDEASSDDELVQHFIDEMHLTADQAKVQVARRDYMLGCMSAAWPIKGK